MAENSHIEWTTHTFNPWRGCTKVSEGCKFCYADVLSGRNPATLGIWGPKGTRVIASESYWKQPLKWNREAQDATERPRVFCASLADVFEGRDTMPADAWEAVGQARMRLFDLIDHTPNLDWLLLTKRPENVMNYVPERWYRRCSSKGEPKEFPSNVWIGTSVENQATADERIPHLLKVPARVKFLSCEPLLGPVNLYGNDKNEVWPWADALLEGCGVNWVICGGESGPNARPMHPEWARSLRDQCETVGVPFLFKQHGEWLHESQSEIDLWARHCKNGNVAGNVVFHREFGGYSYKVGKKAAGRWLDGVTHDGYPVVAA